MSDVIERAAAHVRAVMSGESSGHDWWHIERVWRLARRIGEAEGAELPIVELAALLHDLGDHKFHGGDLTAAPRIASEWLRSEGADAGLIARVAVIIGTLSFKGAGVPTPMHTLEGQVVQDADRLDAIGAVGIARAFAYGGWKGQEMHDPAFQPAQHDSFDAYQRVKTTTINHFYEKLLLLKDRMNTPTARRIAEARHAYMQEFLRQFLTEWEGTDG